MKKHIPRTVSEMLGIVPEADRSIIKLTIICMDTALVQNFGRVYEYTDSCVSFIQDDIICEIHGSSLILQGLNPNAVKITGTICHINYRGSN